MKFLIFKLLKFLIIFIIICIAFVLLYLFFAWLLSNISTRPQAEKCSSKQKIHISSNGVHMDIIFHRDLLEESVIRDLGVKPEDEYLAFGWGDRGFYLDTPTWAELKFKTAINAAFLLSETVMHVTHFESTQEDWVTIDLCDSQLASIKQFVYGSFRKDHQGNILKIKGKGYTTNDFFYKAIGNYSCFYTCNVWVNQALKKGQIKTAVWSPFDKGILKYLMPPQPMMMAQ